MLMWSRRRNSYAKPFCDCFGPHVTPAISLTGCQCGENIKSDCEWEWETTSNTETGWVTLTADRKEVTFHPFYSNGTALVRGNIAMAHGHIYYWELKMLSEPYGTDIMVGIGTDKIDTTASRYRFTSLLGQDTESYGLSYTGGIRHKDDVIREGPGFCKGTIIGIKVDLWRGTLEFSLNRKSRGVSFFNLRRHPSLSLYPMISSTAAQSTLRLIYAGSYEASLLVDAAKILGASVSGHLPLPPGFRMKMKSNFWLTLPNESCISEEREKEKALSAAKNKKQPRKNSALKVSGMKRKHRREEAPKKPIRCIEEIDELDDY